MNKKKSEYINKTIEQLENDYWPPAIGETFLITRCTELRKKKLKDFTIEDLRIMIGQSIGLKYLMPIAIEKLHENPMVLGDFYPGDLLQSVLKREIEYWNSNKDFWQKIYQIIKEIDFEGQKIKFDLTKFKSSKWNKNH